MYAAFAGGCHTLITLSCGIHCPQAGGFKGIYNGVGAAFLGGVPGAALFFTAYDTTRGELQVRV